MAGLFQTSSEEIRILNLACGRSDETGVLLDLLAPHAVSRELFGIDIRHREIAEANERWKKRTKGQASFVVHDGTKIDELAKVREPFDFAFMRHQNFWNSDTTWFKIYDQALHALKPHGCLIITSYFDREHLLALKAIESLKANLLLTYPNPRSRLIDASCQKSADKHIAIFNLKNPSHQPDSIILT